MLSDKLKKLRTENTKLTQSEFAKKIDVARTTYAMYEQGNREPDYKTLEKIADYYDVTTDYLLGRSDNPRMTAEEEFQAFANDPELERWYRKLPESNEEDVRKLREMWEIIRRDKK